MSCFFGDNCDCSTLLMFFLLLIVLFDSCGICGDNDETLLFFFLLLVIIFTN
ncbi:hypothetical protein DES36_102196 [Alkalibaculum bacchi]|uniref:Uncharacterized protein n=1 Tax=Alkalibaculum bacchi TaxID=645887 RepID=A0A366IF39_9FIRM|nr:hypothetical protein [Alkalibaculum bacchi]RBP69052.1 hypothetical protein DES36_102196 [Alkalibaculum bacchi]